MLAEHTGSDPQVSFKAPGTSSKSHWRPSPEHVLTKSPSHCLRLGLLGFPVQAVSPLTRRAETLPLIPSCSPLHRLGKHCCHPGNPSNMAPMVLCAIRTILAFHFDIDPSTGLLSGLIVLWFPVWKTMPQRSSVPFLFTLSFSLEGLSFA